ncbi:dihydrolipoamide dehydrogenase [Caloramator quimbayensis]|uniref:Dihydrolipoyl dehydrogenase n=1 Tax=Caloramator quimbayensis TaxID=1147123 RepID=A0A1T4XEX7_9CLOT|nr:dihydrolipoyl dehydrogenase [Caloramator quimbayensis]SKA88132.1 dihydrolipoamide dehydrogenase [Caloramator quimbayensis]
MSYDIGIIGAGPGGYTAAIRAAQLGAKVCLIEKDNVGGTCLNRGCIPTKALYKNADVLNLLNNIDEFGVKVDSYSIDIKKMHERKQSIIENLSQGIKQLIKGNGIDYFEGNASITDTNNIEVVFNDGKKENIECSNIIIATGSKPNIPHFLSNVEGLCTSEELLNFEDVPERLAIIGGGVIGMEFACIFNALQSKVTVFEFLPSIISNVDSEIAKRLSILIKKKGIEINTSTKVNRIEKSSDGYILYAEGKKGEVSIDADKVLVSTGRIPNVEGLNLDALGVEYDNKGIKVDVNYETNVKGIYAIGDVNGISMLAHAASHQGINVVERILTKNYSLHKNIVPSCIFTFPEVASAGITEDEAKIKNLNYKVSKFMFGANGKALTLGEAEGIVKVIAVKEEEDDEYKIAGVHIIGPHASDIIHEGILAIENKMTVNQIKKAIHAHPTLSEAFYEAVMGINEEAIHMIYKR